MQNILDSPFPASVMSNLLYPLKHIQTNMILGHVFKGSVNALDNPLSAFLPIVKTIQDLLMEERWYILWHGFTPVVIADFVYLSSYSFASWMLFRRKMHIRERFRFTEDNERAAQECLLRLVANFAAHPFRLLAIRCMAQLAGKESLYRLDIANCVLDGFNYQKISHRLNY